MDHEPRFLIGVGKDSRLAGNEIRFLRKNMGFTGKRLSEIMGVDYATISQ
ncbi:MAG: hypothetical protein WA151_08930 [Desulfatirhabdiaceae bacterium]